MNIKKMNKILSSILKKEIKVFDNFEIIIEGDTYKSYKFKIEDKEIIVVLFKESSEIILFCDTIARGIIFNSNYDISKEKYYIKNNKKGTVDFGEFGKFIPKND